MNAPEPIGEIDLDRALALEPVDEGRLRAMIEPGWDIRGVPHGGYLLALLAAAAETAVPQPHPLSISATYLAAPDFAPADLTVDVARLGRRQSTVSVRLTQDGVERVRATVTQGTLVADEPDLLEEIVRPSLPDPDDCHTHLRPSGEALALHDRIDVRLDPSTGFHRGQPSGPARLDGWLALSNGRAPDPLALLLFSDSFPPSIFEARGVEIGHVPTVQLTTHLFALPEPGWVQGSFRTRIQGGSYVDEDGELWDGAGRLVATTRQLALVR